MEDADRILQGADVPFTERLTAFDLGSRSKTAATSGTEQNPMDMLRISW